MCRAARRWGIETFFKEIKQTLQIRTFVGFSRNAIEWQVWSALLTYLLMRIVAFLSEWKRDFKHFFTLMKGALWAKRTVRVIVSRYGTASSPVLHHMVLVPKPFFKENHL